MKNNGEWFIDYTQKNHNEYIPYIIVLEETRLGIVFCFLIPNKGVHEFLLVAIIIERDNHLSLLQ